MKTRRIKLPSVDIEGFIFGFLMFASTMSFVTIFGIKIWYIALIVGLLYLLQKNRIRIPHTIVFVLLGLVVISSFINAYEFGIKRDCINCILGFALITIAYTFVKRLNIKKIDEILEKVAWLNAIAVLINTVIQIDAIKEYLFLRYLDHPVLSTLSVGGTNIDATWLSLYNIALYRNKHKWVYFTFSIIINTLYAARVGYLINLFSICVFLYYDRKKIYKFLLGLIIALPMVIPYALQSQALSMSLARFSGIGTSSDEGGMHRIIMWTSAPKVVINYPFGTGIGNTIEALNKVTGVIHYDGNLHNLILEYFCMSGIIGGVLYLILMAYFVKYCIKYKDSLDSITLMLAGYLLAGLVQFSGDESIMFLLVGGFLGMKSLKSSSMHKTIIYNENR